MRLHGQSYRRSQSDIENETKTVRTNYILLLNYAGKLCITDTWFVVLAIL